MDDIDALAEQYRTLLTDLATLKQMDGPEMLLPGRIELYHQTFREASEAQQSLQNQIEALGRQLADERERLDKGVAQFGPKGHELR